MVATKDATKDAMKDATMRVRNGTRHMRLCNQQPKSPKLIRDEPTKQEGKVEVLFIYIISIMDLKRDHATLRLDSIMSWRVTV